MGGEELVEVLCVDRWDGDVLCVVEEEDVFVAAGCPPLAEVVGLHSSHEAFGEVRLKVEQGGGEVVCRGIGIDEGIDFLTGVLLA